RADGVVLVESKWGQLGRYIHTCADHIYGDNTCTYYRSSRTGHVLRGLQGPRAEHSHVTAQTNEPAVAEIEGKLSSPGKAPRHKHGCACGKPYTQKQWRQWALWRQRQAEAAG